MSKIIDLTVKLYVKISTYNKIQEIWLKKIKIEIS